VAIRGEEMKRETKVLPSKGDRMGLFKQMKDMKDMVETAPERVRAGQAMGAQAQEMAAAQRAAAAAQMASVAQAASSPPSAGAPADAVSTEPIAGVSLPLYADIARDLAAYSYDQSKGVEVAASKGVSADSWTAAVGGWNERIKSDRAVAQEFNRLYTER
jgi:hypothetical protein